MRSKVENAVNLKLFFLASNLAELLNAMVEKKAKNKMEIRPKSDLPPVKSKYIKSIKTTTPSQIMLAKPPIMPNVLGIDLESLIKFK